MRSEISGNNCTNAVAFQFNTANIMALFSNNILTQKTGTDSPNEISACFTLMEDKLNGNILALKDYFT